MQSRSSNIVHRIHRTLVFAALVFAALLQVGCTPRFAERNVFFNASQSRGKTTEVAVLALSDSEWGKLKLDYKASPKERKPKIDEQLAGEWKSRSKVLTLEGNSEHSLMTPKDALWRVFRDAKSSRNDKMEWFVVLVLSTNWNGDGAKDGWFAGYRGAPEDQFGDEVTSVDFAWVQEGKVGGPKLVGSDAAAP